MGEPVAIGGDNLPFPVQIGLTDLPNIGGASGPPGPPGSGITLSETTSFFSAQMAVINQLPSNVYSNSYV